MLISKHKISKKNKTHALREQEMKTGNPDVQQTQNQNQNTLLIPKKIMWSQLLQNNKKSNYLN